MDWLGNAIFEEREVENERLELTDKEVNYILGPNLTLRNCTLVLKVSSGAGVTRSRLRVGLPMPTCRCLITRSRLRVRGLHPG